MGRKMTPLAEPLLRAISLGGGIQSTTLVLMAAHGEIGPMPDCAIFADTGAETKATYEHIRWLGSGNVLPFPVHVLDAGDLKSDLLAGIDQTRPGRGFAPIPYFLDNGPGQPQGRGQRQCTGRYKVEVLAAEHKRLCDVGAYKNMAPNTVEVWIGISTDEVYRMKPANRGWQRNRWPLIEKKMSRRDCVAWLESNGYPVPPRSSCAFCPFHSDHEWERIKVEDADAWQSAVDLDRQLRQPDVKHRLGLRADPYLHRSMKPLDEVAFVDRAQRDLFLEECEGVCGQ